MLDITAISKTFHPGTPNARQALRQLSLHLEDGEFATILGSNGAGKSTLFGAIAGSFYTDEGRILLDGTDLTFQPEHRRSRVIGRLFQDPMRGTAPHMTIEENLALAYLRTAKHQHAFFSRTSKADRALFRDQLARLEMGLEDRMGQPVGLLSGGQRQKIGIARALLCRAPYIIFDEATSSVDQQSEEEIWRCIDELAQTRTLVIISHRLSTIRKADCIYVLSGGKIEESGRHEVLMKKNGLYHRLVTEQQKLEEQAEEGRA